MNDIAQWIVDTSQAIAFGVWLLRWPLGVIVGLVVLAIFADSFRAHLESEARRLRPLFAVERKRNIELHRENLQARAENARVRRTLHETVQRYNATVIEVQQLRAAHGPRTERREVTR